jgi:hypothetical protein
MSYEGSATPEEAARGDIPERYARALSVAISPDGDEAIVVLGTNEEPYLYPYEEHCFREGGHWFGGSGISGIGFGWSLRTIRESGPALGVVRLSGEVPDGVREVVVEWDGREQRVPATDGYFFFTRWDVPEDFRHTIGIPRAVRQLRDDGTEEPIEPHPFFERAWEWRPGGT